LNEYISLIIIGDFSKILWMAIGHFRGEKRGRSGDQGDKLAVPVDDKPVGRKSYPIAKIT